MEQVDNYIPTPKRDIDMPFMMPIESTHSITGRGTVVTGMSSPVVCLLLLLSSPVVCLLLLLPSPVVCLLLLPPPVVCLRLLLLLS